VQFGPDDAGKLTQLKAFWCFLTHLLQTQSDLIGIPVKRPAMRETTALGAAIAAGLAVGVWENIEELKNINTEGSTTFKPAITKEESASRFSLWTKAVEMSRGWAS